MPPRTTPRPGRSIYRRRFATRLRQLRDGTGKTIEEVAALAKQAGSTIGVATISRWERAMVLPRPDTLRTYLSIDAFGLKTEEIDVILGMARVAQQPPRWIPYSGVVAGWFGRYLDIEEEADGILAYEPSNLDGLVQIAPYAEAMIRATRPELSDEQVSAMVELRRQRQQRILDGDLSLVLVTTDDVLTRAYGGPKVRRAQLEHLYLLTTPRFRRVTIQLLPSDAPPALATPFRIADFANAKDPAMVYIETELGALYLDKPDEVRRYARDHGALRAAARSPEDSAATIAQQLEGLSDATSE